MDRKRIISPYRREKVFGVLRELEEAARTPNAVHLMDLSKVFSKKHWSVYQEVDWDLFTPAKQSRTPDANSISRLMTSAFELDVMISMLNALTSTALTLQKRLRQCQEPIVSRLSKGIASLPDELLLMIFKFAVWDEGRKGARQAVRFSQVSRRFREASLRERSLWTTLRSDATRDELETIVSRSGSRTELHAFIHFDDDFRSSGLRVLMSVCQPMLCRWKTLSLTGEIQNSKPTLPSNVDSTLLSLQFYARQLDGLQELYTQGSNIDPSSRSTATLSIFPNLRSFRSSHYLPSPLVVVSSVTTFAFALSLGHIVRIYPLIAFLPSMPNVSHFELELHVGNGISIYGERALCAETVCSAIKSFHLRLRRIGLSKNQDQEIAIASLLQALRMPLLEDLVVSVGFLKMGKDEGESTQSLTGLSRALLPLHLSDPHAHLSSLSYKLWYDIESDSRGGPLNGSLKFKEFPGFFSIPVDRIPTVSTLTVTACTCVLFTREGGGAQVNGGRPGSSSEQCRLREMSFVGCENLEEEDFHLSVQSLKDVDAWNTLERVVIENCCCLPHEEVLAVVGEERLCYL